MSRSSRADRSRPVAGWLRRDKPCCPSPRANRTRLGSAPPPAWLASRSRLANPRRCLVPGLTVAPPGHESNPPPTQRINASRLDRMYRIAYVPVRYMTRHPRPPRCAPGTPTEAPVSAELDRKSRLQALEREVRVGSIAPHPITNRAPPRGPAEPASRTDQGLRSFHRPRRPLASRKNAKTSSATRTTPLPSSSSVSVARLAQSAIGSLVG
jgi:hypothetical protein